MKLFRLDCKKVLRDNYICDLAKGKSTLHLGCTDSPFHEEAYAADRLLHLKLAKITHSLKGVDIDAKAIDFLKSINKNLDLDVWDISDCERATFYTDKYQIVILSDVLEHIPNPGLVIDNVSKIMTSDSKLIVTVPNSFAMKGFIRALLGIELVHEDHLCYYSFATLETLLKSKSLSVTERFSFFGGGKSLLAHAFRPIVRLLPWMADGIGVVVTRK